MQVLYVLDTETTGTDEHIHDIIELSLYRLTDNAQKTFYIQPVNWDSIQEDALRINGHKLEDLRRGFRLNEDGSKTIYNKPDRALVEIENFLMEDLVSAAERIPVGHNLSFDLRFLQELWRRSGQENTYPFGRMFLDTMQIAFFLDYINGTVRDGGYNLGGVVKALDIKKEKAHRADADVRMTKDVFLKLVESATTIKKSISITDASLDTPKKGRGRSKNSSKITTEIKNDIDTIVVTSTVSIEETESTQVTDNSVDDSEIDYMFPSYTESS